MKKYILLLVIIVIASATLNIVQYRHIKSVEEKLAFFENNLGSYDEISKSFKQSEEEYKRARTIFIDIKPGTLETQTLEFQSLIESENEIQSVKYTSENQVIDNFKIAHKNDYVTLQGLEEINYNPLGASLEITIKDPVKKQQLVDFIESNDKNQIINHINF